MSATIRDRVIGVIAKYRKVAPESIAMETTWEQLAMDSLEGINLVFELEEEFNISIPDDKALGMRTVGQIVERVERLLSGEAPADTGTATQS